MPFIQKEFIENSKHLFAVGIELLQVVAKRFLILPAAHPLLEQFAWNVNIAPQSIGGMATQE